jgi:hypothetical protein
VPRGRSIEQGKCDAMCVGRWGRVVEITADAQGETWAATGRISVTSRESPRTCYDTGPRTRGVGCQHLIVY